MAKFILTKFDGKKQWYTYKHVERCKDLEKFHQVQSWLVTVKTNNPFIIITFSSTHGLDALSDWIDMSILPTFCISSPLSLFGHVETFPGWLESGQATLCYNHQQYSVSSLQLELMPLVWQNNMLEWGRHLFFP